MKKNSNSI